MQRLLSRRTVLAGAALTALGALAGCGTADSGGRGAGPGPTVTPSATSTPPATPTTVASPTTAGDQPLAHPSGAQELVLRVDMGGGFVVPQFAATRLPLFALYGDGSVITPGAQIAIYPAPALPSLQVTPLTETGLQAVLRAAQTAGLLDGDRAWVNFGGVADAPTTTFTVNAAGQSSTVSVYALGMDMSNAELSPAEADARAKLSAFENQLGGLRGWLPAGAISGDDRPYEIERLQLIVQPADPPASAATPESGDIQPSQQPWPLATPLAQFGQPYNLLNSRCDVIQGADLATLMDALKTANELTQWESDGQLFTIYLRPLLPDENECLLNAPQ